MEAGTPPPSTRELRRERLLSRLGLFIQYLRGNIGITQKDLADRARVSVRFLAQVEAGKGNISVARLADLTEALQATPSEVLGWAEKRGTRSEKKRVIALVGLRGAGKSTIGAALAKKLDVPFAELDALVAAEAGMSLSTIFEVHGDAYFRNVEREALRKFLEAHEPTGAVLATGGSIVNAEETYEKLRESAIVVWLAANPNDHWERVVAQGDGRPMEGRPHAMAELRAILKSRRDRYAKAHLRVDTSRSTVKGSVARIAKFFSENGATVPARLGLLSEPRRMRS